MVKTPEIFNQEKIESKKVIFLGNEIIRRDSGERWFLTEDEIKKAKNFYEKEKINPLTKENLYLAGIDAILSIGENSKKQKKILKKLQDAGLDEPKKIIGQADKLEKLLKESDYKPRFYNKIPKFILGFSSWFLRSNLPNEIIRDTKKEKGIEFRDKLADRHSLDKVPGMGPKVASLFLVLCGYENVAVLDLHMWRFLNAHSKFPEKIPDERHSGL
ncbi:hypothetical protein FJZ41_00010 [Candidatus Shapirobacteria bacterium]|nr:hypothetical protein [Candidatus Shapirobacteria bacterium]